MCWILESKHSRNIHTCSVQPWHRSAYHNAQCEEKELQCVWGTTEASNRDGRMKKMSRYVMLIGMSTWYLISICSNLKALHGYLLHGFDVPHLRRLPGHCWHKHVFQLELFQWEHTPQIGVTGDGEQLCKLKQPIYLESSLSIPDFPESLKHCCVKHLGLFQHIHTLISYNLKTRPKQNVLKCLEPLESVKARVTCKVSPVPKSSRPSRTTRRLHKA